ncbi:MAG: FecR family protein [Parapedobacter sp.]|nr:MAG: FecR family protein [Parapedobacter sp.]
MKSSGEFERITVEELIADDSFVQWVKCPDNALEAYWKSVGEQTDGNRRAISEAKILVELLDIRTDAPPKHAKERVLERINKQLTEHQPVRRRLWDSPILKIAAGILCIVAIGIWIYRANPDFRSADQSDYQQYVERDLKGMLYLNDGRSLAIADLADGVIAEYDDAIVRKGSGNRLIYEWKGQRVGNLRIDSLRSPARAVWELELPDGSIAWLNARSTLRFTGGGFSRERRVVIDGEAYFAVAHDAGKPFVVETGAVQTTVLGTQFVVSYYDREQLGITLLEGAVNVKHADGNGVAIAPGEQARYSGQGTTPEVSKVDIDRVATWRKGFFSFSDDSIMDVMNVLSRWYGVKVSYEGPKPEQGISGTVPYGGTLEEVLAILTDTGLDARFIVEDGAVIVKKQ